MTMLGAGLGAVDRHEEHLDVLLAQQEVLKALPDHQRERMNHLGNLAHCYTKLGKHKQAVDLHRRLLKIISLQHGESSEHTFSIISSLALALHKAGEMSEAKDLLREHIPVAERTFGREHDMTIGLRWTYANLLREDATNGETLASDLVDAFRTFESIAELWRRQRPKNDPDLMGIEKTLKLAGDDLNRLAEYLQAAGMENAVERFREVVGDVIGPRETQSGPGEA